MTNVQLPDEMAKELVNLTGQPTPEAAVLEAVSDYLQYHRQLRVLELEGKFDADPTYDGKSQRQIP